MVACAPTASVLRRTTCGERRIARQPVQHLSPLPPNTTALKLHLLGKAPNKRQSTQDQPVPARQSRDIVRRE
jgi:hypothetical protein